MKAHLSGVTAAALLFTACPLFAQKIDINQPQSPPKPTPAWVKMIDQGKNDPRLKGYFSPLGLKVEIVADAPQVINPVGMTFGNDGTLYVLEWIHDPGNNWSEFGEKLTYKDGTTRTVATMKKRVKDVVKVMHRTKEGTYDKAEVVLEDELPSSILVHDGWLYLSGRSTIRRYKQSKEGGPYDVKEVIAQGFCGFHHHQVSGMTIGNDGWLYITAGDDDNYVEGSDGSRATVLRTGAIFRCRPDGSKMQTFSMGYRNPYRDVQFDAAFNMFHSDNDNEDGSKFMGCRIMHVAEESDFGWRLYWGARCCRPDNDRGAVYGELPGKMPPLLKTGRGAPAGLLIYNDTRLPEQYRGLLYYPDVFRKLIRAYKVDAHLSSFVVTHEFEFLKSEDPLFRPCQMVTGPDGAIYICDWRTNSGGAGQLSGDGEHGRIYRVSWAGTEDQPAIALRGMDSWDKLTRASNEDLIKALAAPDFTDRQRAQWELVRRGKAVVKPLRELADDSEAAVPARIAALGALESFWNDEVQDTFISVVRQGTGDLRRLAADGLGLNAKPGDDKAEAALLTALGDPFPPVRRAVALALGRVGGGGAADALVNAYRDEKENDVFLKDAYLRGIERMGKPGIEKLMALAQSGVDKDLDKVVDAFCVLRTPAAAEQVPQLLAYPHLAILQRVDLIESYRNYLFDPPVSVDPVIDYLTKHADEAVQVKLAGLQTLALPGVRKSNDKLEALANSLLEDDDPGIRLALIKTIDTARLTKLAVPLAKLLDKAERPAAEREAILKALRSLNDATVAPAVQAILTKKDQPTEMRLQALRTLVSLDAKTAREPAKALLDENDVALQGEAVITLGAQADGARLVGERFVAKKLPRELLPQVSEALRKHAGKDPELGKLLTEVMKGGLLLSLDKTEVERLQNLVRTKGNAQRGRELYLNAKLLACINCHRMEGVGGNVGPDLTRLWDTATIEKIMESIIDPSKEIKEGYDTWVATTKKGQVFTGLRVSQNADEVVIREASAREVRIPMKEIDELTKSKTSLMPDNVVSQLSFDQFVDLIAFLKDRKSQESLRGMALEYWVAGPFPADHVAEVKGIDPTKKLPGAKPGEEVAWEARHVEPKGYLNLRSAFATPDTAAYALTYVYSPKAQPAQVKVGASDKFKVWLNDESVHQFTDRRPARPDADTVEVQLKEGWNTLVVRVNGVGPEHGIYLRLVGPSDLRLSLRPEGK